MSGNNKSDLETWLKARVSLKEAKKYTLVPNTKKILEVFGGINGCIDILLSNPQILTIQQCLKLTKVLNKITINNKNKVANINKKNNEIDDTSTKQPKKEQTNISSIGSECIQHITSFLPINEISKSFKNVSTSFGVIGLNEIKKLDYFYMNGHDLINIKIDENKYINVCDIGHKSLLNSKRVYKDTEFKDIFQQLAESVNIPSSYLSIWHYTKRKNRTLRPNRLITSSILNMDEIKNKVKYPDYQGFMKSLHIIPTKSVHKTVKSIYRRIGNFDAQKRMFTVFDSRLFHFININPDKLKLDYPNCVLILLKYFDIFTQKLYFVDWIIVEKDNCSIQDIAGYIESKLITSSNKYYFDKFKECLIKMNGSKRNKLLFYEEQNPYLDHVEPLLYTDIIGDQWYNGDILIFQLNRHHSYFLKNPISFTITINSASSVIYNEADDFIKSIQSESPFQMKIPKYFQIDDNIDN